MFIKLQPGGLITPVSLPRVRKVGGARAATPVSLEEDRRARTPAQIVGRYQHMASRDDDPGHVEPARTVRQIMSSPVITLAPDAHLDEAWALVTKRRFRHIPVVDPDSGVVAGMLSDRDLLAAGAQLGQGVEREVSEIMATTVMACRPDTSIRVAAEVMLEQRIGALPVVSEIGSPVGIVTRVDILRAVVHEAPLELWI